MKELAGASRGPSENRKGLEKAGTIQGLPKSRQAARQVKGILILWIDWGTVE